MACYCFPLCFCVLCFAEERNDFFFCFSLLFPPKNLPFHILTVCTMAIYFLNSGEDWMRNADQCFWQCSYFYSFFISDQTHLKTILRTEYACFFLNPWRNVFVLFATRRCRISDNFWMIQFAVITVSQLSKRWKSQMREMSTWWAYCLYICYMLYACICWQG